MARARHGARPTVRGMEERTFAVTFVRIGTGLPYFEVGAYRYTAEWLPAVGDVITITPVEYQPDGPGDRLAYVTRVDASSETPIRVTEPSGVVATSPDDYIVAA